MPSRVRGFVARTGNLLLCHVPFHIYTLWLFIFSDLKTIVIPSTIFGTINAIAAACYDIPAAQSTSAYDVLRRIPWVAIWVSANLLPFAINNQLSPSSVKEDAINKPWRPMCSGRLGASSAKLLMITLYVAAQLLSLSVTGGLRQGLGLVVLGTWYNNMGGGDCHPAVRNLINALGYICFTSGAMEVALRAPSTLLAASSRLAYWLFIIGGVIFTTVHAQDMYDQEGDASRGRRTLPLVIGDVAARWTILVAMISWGLICPSFWDTSMLMRVVGFVAAGLVGFRSLFLRDVASDKTTFLYWNFWIAYVYALPLSEVRPLF
ncbi:Fumagillin beta-trans-bergamotene synthase af520 [Paramyrothecium foliicola]|nr:Fumagillin beta-trans-bergamotene synthase af520 [Paramyrothecium foliicola]